MAVERALGERDEVSGSIEVVIVLAVANTSFTLYVKIRMYNACGGNVCVGYMAVVVRIERSPIQPAEQTTHTFYKYINYVLSYRVQMMVVPVMRQAHTVWAYVPTPKTHKNKMSASKVAMKKRNDLLGKQCYYEIMPYSIRRLLKIRQLINMFSKRLYLMSPL